MGQGIFGRIKLILGKSSETKRHAQWQHQSIASREVKDGVIVQLLNEYTGLLLRTPQATLLFDPAYITVSLKEIPPPDGILISHSASEHFEAKTVHAVAGKNTKIMGTAKVIDALKRSRWKFEESNLVALLPGDEVRAGKVAISVMRALHPEDNVPGSFSTRALVALAKATKGIKGETPLSFLLKQEELVFYHAMDSLRPCEDGQMELCRRGFGGCQSLET